MSVGAFEIGARLAYGIPFGKGGGGITGGYDVSEPLSHLFSGAVPIWIDAGYRIIPNIYVGLYVQYAPVSIASTTLVSMTLGCYPGVSCSASIVRYGVNAQLHLLPQHSFDVWVGAGIGYENAQWTASNAAASVTDNFSGLEFLNVQAGGDFRGSSDFGIGPFAALTLGKYSSYTNYLGNQESTPDQTTHAWLMFGVRGRFDIHVHHTRRTSTDSRVVPAPETERGALKPADPTAPFCTTSPENGYLCFCSSVRAECEERLRSLSASGVTMSNCTTSPKDICQPESPPPSPASGNPSSAPPVDAGAAADSSDAVP